jgi:hypothetical protein
MKNHNTFPWGKVIERLDYDFDGKKLEIVKAHPWKNWNSEKPRNQREFDADRIIYSCEELGVMTNSVVTMLLYWIVVQGVGDGREGHVLFTGICRMLTIDLGEGW